MVEIRVVVDFRPRGERHGDQDLADGRLDVDLQQVDEVGDRPASGDTDEVQIGRVARCELTGEQ